MRSDLMRVYRQVCSECPQGTTQSQVYEIVVNMPAPRFYVDPRSALNVISPLVRGDRSALERMKPLRRQMYEDLFDVVLTMSRQQAYWGRDLYPLLKDAVLKPAKRFYIGSTRMSQIWNEKVKEIRRTGK